MSGGYIYTISMAANLIPDSLTPMTPEDYISGVNTWQVEPPIAGRSLTAAHIALIIKTCPTSHSKEQDSMFFGLMLIFVGVILLLERLNILEGGFGTYWPVILIAFGLSIFISHQRRRRD